MEKVNQGGDTGKMSLDFLILFCVSKWDSVLLSSTQLMLVNWLIMVRTGIKASRPGWGWAKWYSDGTTVSKQLVSKAVWSQPPGARRLQLHREFSHTPQGRLKKLHWFPQVKKLWELLSNWIPAILQVALCVGASTEMDTVTGEGIQDSSLFLRTQI